MKNILLSLSAFMLTFSLFAQPTYCNSNLHGSNTCNAASGYIDSVEIASTTLQNYGTSCNNINGYTAYPALGSTTTNIAIGSSYTLNVKLTGVINTATQNDISAWIDYNQDGTFSASEWIDLGRGVDSTGSSAFTVPSNAVLGQTGLRIRNRYAGAGNDSTDACTNFSSGETEDYILTITGTTAINKNKVANRIINLYPNPVKDLLNIEFDLSQTEITTIKIISGLGQEIYSRQHQINMGKQREQLDVSGYKKGIYFIKFIRAEEITVKKIIIE